MSRVGNRFIVVHPPFSLDATQPAPAPIAPVRSDIRMLAKHSASDPLTAADVVAAARRLYKDGLEGMRALPAEARELWHDLRNRNVAYPATIVTRGDLDFGLDNESAATQRLMERARHAPSAQALCEILQDPDNADALRTMTYLESYLWSSRGGDCGLDCSHATAAETVTLSALIGEKCPNMRRLEIYNLAYTPAAAAALARLARLEYLRLASHDEQAMPLPTGVIAALAGSRSLQHLGFDSVGVPAEGLAALADLASLRSLRLCNAAAAHATDSLPALTRLRSLQVIDRGIDDRFVASLGTLTGLTCAVVWPDPLVDLDVAPMTRLTALTTLDLRYTRLNRSKLVALALGCHLVRSLTVASCGLDDAAGQSLKLFEGLESLACDGNTFGDSTARGLMTMPRLRDVTFEAERLSKTTRHALLRLWGPRSICYAGPDSLAAAADERWARRHLVLMPWDSFPQAYTIEETSSTLA